MNIKEVNRILSDLKCNESCTVTVDRRIGFDSTCVTIYQLYPVWCGEMEKGLAIRQLKKMLKAWKANGANISAGKGLSI